MTQYLYGLPMPPAPSIHAGTCVHVSRATGQTCGQPVPLDRQHAWLCDEHESVIARYTAMKTYERAAS